MTPVVVPALAGPVAAAGPAVAAGPRPGGAG